MKIIVACCTPWLGIETIQNLLNLSGIQQPKAAKRDKSETIEAWHNRIFKAYSDDGKEQQSITPSKPWEQMATEIFAANADQDCWGWINPKSAWLLDFWLNYDPHFRFILVYAPPHKDFATFIKSAETDYKITEFVKVWLSYNSELLKFHNRHTDRSILINYEACINSPQTFNQVCSEKLALGLGKINAEAIDDDNTSSLLELLAKQLLEPYQEINALYAEMEASATVIESASIKNKSPNILLIDAISEYQSLNSQSQQLLIVQDKAKCLADESTELANRLSDVDREQKQLRQQLEEAHRQQQKLQSENQQENELLLLQLHQTQEELEHYFVESQSTKAVFETRIIEIETERERLAHDNNQLIAIKTDLENQISVKNAEYDQLQQAQEHTQQQWHEAQIHADALQNQVQQENELLLLQLHQVQEEVEHYFMEYQFLKTKTDQTSLRWQRIFSRFPDLSDYSSIDLNDITIKKDYREIKWTIHDYLQGNREIQLLEFKTIIDKNIPALIFEKNESNNNLLSWTVHLGNQSEFKFSLPTDLTKKQEKDLNTAFTQWVQLAATDWLMLKGLITTLINVIEQDNSLPSETRQKIEAKTWIDPIKSLLQAYLDTPNSFRFDHVALYKEQVNPDYEHLWFKFKEVQFGENYWSEFQFRLSAANVSRQKFTVFPKLEFPLWDDKTPPFENWAVEISDAMGDRMELRFALEPAAIDINVWNGFTSKDQALIASILEQLPFILNIIEYKGNRISRPYEDWKKTVFAMQDVFKLLIVDAK